MDKTHSCSLGIPHGPGVPLVTASRDGPISGLGFAQASFCWAAPLDLSEGLGRPEKEGACAPTWTLEESRKHMATSCKQ